MTKQSLPLAELAAIDGNKTNASVPGILLAAGTSSRYGAANKLLATIEGEPIVRRAARTLLQSGLNDIIVVLGHEADRVRDAFTNLEVSFIVNESYEQGQSTSVSTGVQAAQKQNSDAVLIALGDMPNVSVESIDSILEAYKHGGAGAIAAACDGQRGNPVLFDSQHFEQLTDVSGDIGGRQILLSSDSAILLETGDSGVLRDVDRPEDLPE